MSTFNKNNISQASTEYIDEDIRMANQIMVDLAGGTEEDGANLADKILQKISEGVQLTHNLIIYGEKFHQIRQGDNIRAENTPFNRGLVATIEPKAQPSELIGGREIAIGKSGLVAVLDCVWDPEFDLSEEEIDGLKRHLKGDLVDESNPELAYGGILVLPKFALRASLKV